VQVVRGSQNGGSYQKASGMVDYIQFSEIFLSRLLI